jgi:hypothetical protein
MGEESFASFLNSSFWKADATQEASRYMTSQYIQKIKDCFHLIDPYVQAILLQSVINLTTSQFERIATDHHELCAMCATSEDEWVRRTALAFSEYPKLTVGDDILEFDFQFLSDPKPSPVSNVRRAASRSHVESPHFHLNEPVVPPSQRLPPPRLPQQQSEGPRRIQQPLSLGISGPVPSSSSIPSFEKPDKKKGKTAVDPSDLMLSTLGPRVTQAERSSIYQQDVKKKGKKMVEYSDIMGK